MERHQTEICYTVQQQHRTHDQRCHEYRIPHHMREYMDMALEIQKELLPILSPLITNNEIISTLKRLKNKKSLGPDGCKPELYKALLTKNYSIAAIARCFNKVLETGNTPHEWKISNTIMQNRSNQPLKIFAQ